MSSGLYFLPWQTSNIQQYQSGIMHTLPCNLRFKMSFYRRLYKIAANIIFFFLSCFSLIIVRSVIFCIINILSPSNFPGHRLTVSSKVGELVQNEPNTCVVLFALYHCLFNPFVIFGCMDSPFVVEKKAEWWIMGELDTSLAMLYQLAVVLRVWGNWYMSELWLNCSEWFSDILLLLLDSPVPEPI